MVEKGSSVTSHDSDDDLVTFQRKDHSLRIAASSISSLTGFHPFAFLPKLLMELVYQGSIGHRLWKHDSQLLGITITTQDDILLDLASRAGPQTLFALEEALCVKTGEKRVETTSGAETLKTSVLREAKRSNKLTEKELRVLEDGVRDSVNTGYGNCHEDEALNMYENQCGWEVTGRNEEVMTWDFIKSEDTVVAQMNDASSVPTIVPMGPAFPRHRNQDRSKANCDKLEEDDKRHLGICETNGDNQLKEQTAESDDAGEQSHCAPKNAQEEKRIEQDPLFCIVGSVDGIREELWCPPSCMDPSSDNQDGWKLRRIIVECKHRMKAAKVPPPLYEQIQASVYCLMYNVDEADIIQVIRKQMDHGGERQVKDSKELRIDKYAPEAKDDIGNKITSYFPANSETMPKTGAKENTSSNYQSNSDGELPEAESCEQAYEEVTGKRTHDEASTGTETSTTNTQKKKKSAEIDIVVSRVSLDEPLMQHKTNWQLIVLPRLRSFVEAVYRIRQSDEKRYQLLMAMAEAISGDEQQAWGVVHGECPWLLDCDTAFHRGQ